MALTVLMGGDPVPDLLGVLSGHVYYFFSVLYPRQSGVHFLKTPQWVEAAVGSVFGNPVIRAASNIAQPNEARRFVGRGRRLADYFYLSSKYILLCTRNLVRVHLKISNLHNFVLHNISPFTRADGTRTNVAVVPFLLF